MSEERLKFRGLMDELTAIKCEIKKVSMIVESRLVGLEMPTKGEIEAIKEFEKQKKEGRLKLVPLKKVA